MKYKNEKRIVINVIYIIAICAVLFSCFFADKLSVLFFLKPNYEFSNNTEIHFINVGQGDAIAIKFDNGKVMLIDTGTERYRKKFQNYLDNVVLEGSKNIDYLVLTHTDNDHSGNMMFVLENYNIGTFYRPPVLSSLEDKFSTKTTYWYDLIIKYCLNNDIDMEFNQDGLILNEGFSQIRWFGPLRMYEPEVFDSNELCPVIRIDYNNHSALLTGDISEENEKDIMSKYSADELDVDILKLAHHGSYKSNTYDFISKTSPNFACVSVGENTYKQPSHLVYERILDYDSEYNKNLYSNLYSTLNDGNVIFTLSNDISVKTIANIDNYSFVSYYLCVLVAILILVIFMMIPYIQVWKKNLRFYMQNKKFEKLNKLKEDNENFSKNDH